MNLKLKNINLRIKDSMQVSCVWAIFFLLLKIIVKIELLNSLKYTKWNIISWEKKIQNFII